MLPPARSRGQDDREREGEYQIADHPDIQREVVGLLLLHGRDRFGSPQAAGGFRTRLQVQRQQDVDARLSRYAPHSKTRADDPEVLLAVNACPEMPAYSFSFLVPQMFSGTSSYIEGLSSCRISLSSADLTSSRIFSFRKSQ